MGSAAAIDIPEWVKAQGLQVTYLEHCIRKPLSTIDNLLASDTTVTIANAEEAGGVWSMAITNTNENEGAIATPEFLSFVEGKPWYVQGRVWLYEASANTANYFFGVMSAPAAADSLLDAGAGPKASYSGAGFFKMDNATAKIWIESSVGSTQNTHETEESVVSAGGWWTFGIQCVAVDATYAYINYFADPLGGVNLQPVRVVNTNARVPNAASSQHKIAISGVTEMGIAYLCKTGTTAALTGKVDYFLAASLL